MSHHSYPIASATVSWGTDGGGNRFQSLNAYVEKHGVAHLLTLGRLEEAENRMCDLDFMAVYIDSWDVFVEPWTAWRIIGVEKARLRFLEVAEQISEYDGHTECVYIVSSFLQDVGFYDSGVLLAEWIYERTDLERASQRHTHLSRGPCFALQGSRQIRQSGATIHQNTGSTAAPERHPKTLTSMNNLAAIPCSRKYDKARPLYIRVLEASKNTRKGTSQNTHIHEQPCQSCHVQGKYDKAEPLYIRVLEASKTLGKTS